VTATPPPGATVTATSTATPPAAATPIPTTTATATPTPVPPRPKRDPSDLSVNDAPEANYSGRTSRAVYERLQGILTSHGGSSVGQSSNGAPGAVANTVPAGAVDFRYTIVVGNRNPDLRGRAPGPNAVVIDLPAGLRLAGLTVEATTCRGASRGNFCHDEGSDEDWSERVETWQLTVTEQAGRERLKITHLPTIRWGQRLRLVLLTHAVPATSGGTDLLHLDVWVQPARNETGGSCTGETACEPAGRWMNNGQRFLTRILAPPPEAAAGSQARHRRLARVH
jgi:hypothetical protein